MPTVNITTNSTPVTVSLTTPAATPVTVDMAASASVSVAVSMVAAPAIVLPVTLNPAAVTVAYQEARDGANGTSVTPVVLTLSAYLALSAPEQVDPTKWYVIPA